MKKLLLILLITSIGLFSFQMTDQKLTTKTQQQQTNLKNLQVKISGMTCEMGCARTIESKISKMEGVKFSKVIFSEGVGQFTFDPKLTTSVKIIEKINGIGGGNVYQVTESKEVKKFSLKS